MRVIVVLDQIRAGLGGKEHADLPLGGNKAALGVAELLARQLPKDAVVATFYCGPAYYQAAPATVAAKIDKMAAQLDADLLVLGPAFDDPAFAQMACELGAGSQHKAVVALAQENNAATIAQYAQQLPLIRLPKKGATGLSQALQDLGQACVDYVAGQPIDRYCYP
ncbi:glycine/sarcosine/betaine reductase selenoprotein B family protein [Lacticaseibacillus jixiensis]|uniref:glycine/sarcosine/betaine reductase selenoprotein B family protein n=1 Tax=Lacticaseibacillus jixiensis TaxID=3231926 RepID=UPI0036F21D9B